MAACLAQSEEGKKTCPESKKPINFCLSQVAVSMGQSHGDRKRLQSLHQEKRMKERRKGQKKEETFQNILPHLLQICD